MKKDRQSDRASYALIAFWLLIAAGVALLIAYFTSQPAPLSNATGKDFLRSILEFFRITFTEEQIKQFNPVWRKLAHFTLFFAFGFCVASALQYQKKLPRLPIALAAGALLAVADEARQHFVPGRAPEWQDMLIDFSGVLCAALLVTLIAHLIRRRRAKKQNNIT